jgi:hypothetical protein
MFTASAAQAAATATLRLGALRGARLRLALLVLRERGPQVSSAQVVQAGQRTPPRLNREAAAMEDFTAAAAAADLVRSTVPAATTPAATERKASLS